MNRDCDVYFWLLLVLNEICMSGSITKSTHISYFNGSAEIVFLSHYCDSLNAVSV